jgi:mycoredoxin
MSDRYSLTPSQIVMYTTEVCSDCRRAKAFFEANRISFLQVGLEGDQQATQFVEEINHGYHSVPTIIFPDGTILVEPSWEELRAKIN